MIICRCEEVTKGEIRKSGARWNVHTDGDPPVFKNRHGTLSGTDLCKAGQRNRGKRTERIPRQNWNRQHRAPMRPIEMRVFAAEAKEGEEDEE